MSKIEMKREPTAYIINRKGVYDLEVAYFELDSFLLPGSVRLQPSHKLRIRRVADAKNYAEFG